MTKHSFDNKPYAKYYKDGKYYSTKSAYRKLRGTAAERKVEEDEAECKRVTTWLSEYRKMRKQYKENIKKGITLSPLVLSIDGVSDITILSSDGITSNGVK